MWFSQSKSSRISLLCQCHAKRVCEIFIMLLSCIYTWILYFSSFSGFVILASISVLHCIPVVFLDVKRIKLLYYYVNKANLNFVLNSFCYNSGDDDICKIYRIFISVHYNSKIEWGATSWFNMHIYTIDYKIE